MTAKKEQESSRNFLIVFIAIVLLIFGPPVVYYFANPASSAPACSCGAGTDNETVIVTKVYVVSTFAAVRVLEYGSTCSSNYGTVSMVQATITTQYLSLIYHTGSQTVTVTTTSYPSYAASTSYSTNFINTTVTQCPTIS